MNSYKNAEEALRKAGRQYQMRPKRTWFELQARIMDKSWGKSRGETKPLGDTNYPFFDKLDPVMAIVTVAIVVIGAALAVLL